METKVNEQIEILKDILIKKFNISQLFIFGSQAYGKPAEANDIDLCVVTDLSNKRKIDITRAIRRELINLITYPLDILVYSESEFSERASLKNTLEHKILMDGLRIYG